VPTGKTHIALPMGRFSLTPKGRVGRSPGTEEAAKLDHSPLRDKEGSKRFGILLQRERDQMGAGGNRKPLTLSIPDGQQPLYCREQPRPSGPRALMGRASHFLNSLAAHGTGVRRAADMGREPPWGPGAAGKTRLPAESTRLPVYSGPGENRPFCGLPWAWWNRNQRGSPR
jgi:hypothetical protein